MKTYSNTNTIIVWSTNKDILNHTKVIAKELKFQIYTPARWQDVLAVPCFLIIIDADLLSDELMEMYNEVAAWMNQNECRIIVIGKIKKSIPGSIKKLILEAPYNISKKYLIGIIKPQLKSSKKENKLMELFKKRIYRIIYLYKRFEKKEKVYLDKACHYFDIGEKSLSRDVKILNSLFAGWSIETTEDDDGKYLYNYATSVPKISKKQSKIKVLMNKKAYSIVQLHGMLEKNEKVYVNKVCKHFHIVDRTLRRYIRILNDLYPIKSIGSYEDEKGQYYK